MSLIDEFNAFAEMQLRNPLPSPEVALWFALLMHHNSIGRPESFKCPISILSVRSGLSEREVMRVRNALVQKGLLEWNKNGGRNSATYKMVSLCATQSVEVKSKCSRSVVEVKSKCSRSVALTEKEKEKENNNNAHARVRALPGPRAFGEFPQDDIDFEKLERQVFGK